MNYGRTYSQSTGVSNTAGIQAGGNSAGGANVTKTEIWNGTSWTEVADLATGRTDGGGGRTGSSTESFFVSTGNLLPGWSQATEEWADPVIGNKIVTVS
jgi:hypothetical protein